MFYIGGYIIVLQPLIILFASITGIGNTVIGQGAKLFFVLLKMWDQRIGICRVLMDGIRCDVLCIGGYLQVISWLQLTVKHMILLHPHEGSTCICFAVTVPAFSQYLFL